MSPAFGLALVGILSLPGTAWAYRPGSNCSAAGPQTLIYPGSPLWTPDIRGGATAAITGVNPRSGNGSLDLTTNSSLTDWGFYRRSAPSGSWGLLSDLDCLAFDWYRLSLNTPTDAPWSAQTPALRLYVNDGNQLSELVWEKWYTDPSPTLNDVWHQQDILTDNFWRFVPGHGYTIGNCVSADPFFPNPLLTYSVSGWASSSCFSDQAFVYAIGVGVGSNWPWDYHGFVDNVKLGFAGQQTLVVNDNFELPVTAIPEPVTVVMMATGLLGVGGIAYLRSRRRSR
jgi:hypothetical protein